jgi:uncharacterized protein (DUF1501 family)
VPYVNVGRRELLRRGSLLVALGLTAPSWVARSAAAAAEPAQTGGRARVLVVVQLGGGNDGLNTIVPVGDEAYYRARPTLAIPRAEAVGLVDGLALHPALAPLKALFEASRLAVVQGVGYPNPNRSHFRAMDIWQTGAPERRESSGWLGRYLDAQCCGEQPRGPLATAIGEGTPRAYWNEHVLVPSIPDLERFQLEAEPRERADTLDAFRVIYDDDEAAGQHEALIRRVGADALASSEELKRIAASYRPAVTYPRSQLAGRLQTVAQLISADLGTRIFYVPMGGFDTHAGQRGAHARLLKELGDGLAAFERDLEAHGQSDRVLTMTFSEFGRRVAENGSGGTDHGAAEPMLLLGPVRSGLVGEHPSLTDLDHGDLKHGVDFRAVYATVLAGWLGASAEAVLGERFESLPALL